MASKEALRKTALAALAQWPKDPLRPTAQLGEILAARIKAEPPQYPGSSRNSNSTNTQDAEKQVNAIIGLIGNKYSQKYSITRADDRSMTGGMMLTPRSNPEYYNMLMKDLEELPSRTWAQRMGIRLKGLIRWS